MGRPWRLDGLRATLFLLSVVTLSRVHEASSLLSAVRPALMLFLIAAAAAVLQPQQLEWKGLFNLWPVKLVVGMFVFAAVAAPFGLSLGGTGMYLISSYSKVIVFALLLMAATRSASDLRLFIWAYVFACLLLIYMATFVFDLSGSAGSANLRLSNLYTYDANDLGCVLMVGLPLSVLLFQTSRLPGKVISGIVIAGTGLAIARSGSRGALVGFVVTGLVLLLLVRGVSVGRRVLVIGAVMVTLVFAAPPGYWDQMRTIASPTQDYNWQSKDGRKQVAARGISYMLSSPIFGIGVENFARAEGTISDKAEATAANKGIRWSAAHNSFVQIGAELGFPGLAMFLTLVFGGGISMLRLRRRLPAHWLNGTPDERFIYLSCVYLPASFVGFAVTGFFVSFAYIDPIYVLAAYVTGVYRCTTALSRVRSGATTIAAATPQTPARRRRGGGWSALPPSAPPRITG